MTPKNLFFGTADTTIETVYTSGTGVKTIVESVIISNGAAGAATTLRFNKGAADTVATRWLEVVVPAGPTPANILYPRLVLESGEIISLISTTTDDICVVSINGFVEAT